MKHVFRRSLGTAFLSSCAALAACDSSQSPVQPNEKVFGGGASAAIATGTAASLAVGDTASMVPHSAFAINAIGEGHTVTWKSTASSIVTIDTAGVATGVSAGKAIVVASYLKRSDSLAVTVTLPTVASMSVSASSKKLTVGQSASLSVVAYTAQGNVIANPAVTFTSSSTAIATVSSSGVVSAAAVGSTTLTASSGTVSDSVGVTVSTTSTGTIAAPRAPQLLSFTYPVRTGKQWLVKPTDNLQTVLNQAQRGDEIVLPAGATFTGHFLLPTKLGTAANGWIVIRSDKTLPPQGTRVTPLDAPLMAKIVTNTVAPAIATAPRASGWWISGVEITIDPALTAINYGMVLLGDGSAKQDSLSNVASDLVIERSYVHGATKSNVSRCIALNSARTAIMDSYVFDCHLKGYDSQAIAGWNGPGPFKIVNNTLAGAGENIMFGGSDPHIPNLIPADIEIRRNYVYTPASWKGVWTKKNLIESKNSERVLVEANIFEGSWADAQVGYAVVLKSANQSGRCTWCASRDWKFRNNIVRNVGAGFNLAGREGSNPYPVGERLTRVWVEQTIVENVNVGIYTGDKKMVQLLQNLSELTMRNNSFFTTTTFATVLNIGTRPAATNMELTDNAAYYGTYGFFSSSTGTGEVSLGNVAGTVVFSGQYFVGSQRNGYPRSTFVSAPTYVPSAAGASSALVRGAVQGIVIP